MLCVECGYGGLEVEAQACARACSDADRAELVSVFVHPGAGDSEMSRELAGVHQAIGQARRGLLAKVVVV